ncbi:MAG: tRNA guanosine(34) transglycosylase Tgt [Deltaproteobacteria bacterium]|nr:tRNA guanosine(34) transglycosylase Tgt [Deltaproteobacteria bacterium]MBN2673419.1 tRNA guanosine(34) transglycosylase Tgt [Deltaproteobacteria bacterium]
MTDGFLFQINATDGAARTGCITTPRGNIPTPAFMPVGTRASVKALSPEEISAGGASILLGNTYHLMLRPGEQLIASAGGLANFMAWKKPTLTDSGGFQVFSLSDRVKISDEGVVFSSHIDGSRIALSPQRAVEVQGKLGSDIAMILDECPPGNAPRKDVENAMRRTTLWAKRQIEVLRPEGQALFGIVQGSIHSDLRKLHLDEIAALPFDGIALGGLSVGEPVEDMYRIFAEIAPLMPVERPRYVMGVGTPADLLEAIEHGVDMFDCVMPTRNARNGQVFVKGGKLNIKQARFLNDPLPLEPGCTCPTCATYERRYLRHLFMSKELLIHRLLTIHNLHHYGALMAGARNAIAQGNFAAFKKSWLQPREI